MRPFARMVESRLRIPTRLGRAGLRRVLLAKKAEQLGCIRYCPCLEAAQLYTLRRVVIWLDARSRERDLLAAVVDR